MKKNQEALDYLKGGNMFGELSNEVLESIEALIDKETPMKPKRNLLLCPTCNSDIGVSLDYSGEVISRDNYCCECGQKIDWSDKE